MQLSKRLSAVAEFVTPGGCLVDVGTDHGYVPIAEEIFCCSSSAIGT